MFLLLAGLAALILLLIIARPYRPLAPRTAATMSSEATWSTRAFWFFATFALVYSVASFGTDGLLTMHLSELEGAANDVIGRFGVPRGIGALIGAGAHVWISRRWGLIRTQVLAIAVLSVGATLPLWLPQLETRALVWGLAWGFQETAFVTLAMRFAEGPRAATLFALTMIFSNVGTAIGEALGAPQVARLGYSGVFLSFAAIAAVSGLLIPGMMRPLRERAN